FQINIKCSKVWEVPNINAKHNIKIILDNGEKWCIFHLNGDRWVRVGN
ncbi:MAG: hypothetical protein SCABRO_01474, partial [Candidatus Scalindua brodae]